MLIRSFFVVSSSLLTMAFTADAVQPENVTSLLGCPGLIGNISFHDYAGDTVLQMCVAPQGLSISNGIVNLTVYDLSDGLFHNGFES